MSAMRFLHGKATVTRPDGSSSVETQVRLGGALLGWTGNPEPVKITSALLITRRQYQLTDVDGGVWTVAVTGGCGCGKR